MRRWPATPAFALGALPSRAPARGDLVLQADVPRGSFDPAEPSDVALRGSLGAYYGGERAFVSALAAPRWKTARAAELLGDPAPGPGPGPGASRGAVRGATSVNPTLIVRPREELDPEAGLLLAQATEDLVDPSSASLTGARDNYDGGAPSARDLGVEIDAGFEWRVSAYRGLNLEIGPHAGVFFPGAFDSASGARLGTQYIAVGRLGVQF